MKLTPFKYGRDIIVTFKFEGQKSNVGQIIGKILYFSLVLSFFNKISTYA